MMYMTLDFIVFEGTQHYGRSAEAVKKSGIMIYFIIHSCMQFICY